MDNVQSGPQDAPGVLHGVPAWGISAGQPAAGVAQYHCGGSTVWQMGNCVPNLQELHQQRVPSPYQQDSVASEQALVWLGGGVGQAAGNGGVAQSCAPLPSSNCFGALTAHAPVSHTAVVRHPGRGSSP